VRKGTGLNKPKLCTCRTRSYNGTKSNQNDCENASFAPEKGLEMKSARSRSILVIVTIARPQHH